MESLPSEHSEVKISPIEPRADQPECASSLLEERRALTPHALKHGCCCAWCKTCGRRYFAVCSRKMQLMDWRKVRHIVLTVDPKKFSSPQDAYETIRNVGAVGYFSQALRRQGVRGRYIWVLEWQRNGFPHWHFLWESDRAGSDGMIGKNRLDRAWSFRGELIGWTLEKPVLDEKQWKRLAGYVAKAGYIGEDKEHETELPAWALDVEYRIRRFGNSEGFEAVDYEDGEFELEEAQVKEIFVPVIAPRNKPMRLLRRRRTYRERLNDCGILTDLIWRDQFGNVVIREKLRIPYVEVKARVGPYESGRGLIVQPEAFQGLYNQHWEVVNRDCFGIPF